jgi:hypothetical protein
MLKTVSSITNAIGALNYKGTWDAATNTPNLGALTTAQKGDYYVVSVGGTTTLGGISLWGVGDWAVYNGTDWQRVEGGANSDVVDLQVTNLADVNNLHITPSTENAPGTITIDIIDIDPLIANAGGAAKTVIRLTRSAGLYDVVLRSSKDTPTFGVGTLKATVMSSASGYAAGRMEVWGFGFGCETFARNNGVCNVGALYQTAKGTSGGSTTSTLAIAGSYTQDGTYNYWTLGVTKGGTSASFGPGILEIDFIVTRR